MFRGKLSIKDGMSFLTSIYVYRVETSYIVHVDLKQNQNSDNLYVNQLKKMREIGIRKPKCLVLLLVVHNDLHALH